MTLSVRSKTILALLLSGLSLFFGVVNLRDRANWRLPTDGILWTQSDHRVTARDILDPTEAANNGLQAGDTLVSINGIPIRDLDEYTQIIEVLAKAQSEGSQTTYVVERAETNLNVSTPVHFVLKSQFGLLDVLLALVAFSYLAVGLLILLRHGSAQGAFHFYLTCSVAFVLFLYRYSGRADLFDLFVYWVSAVGLLLLPPLFLHLCASFPQPLAWFKKAERKVLVYLPFLSLLSLHLAWFSGQLRRFGFPRNEDNALLLDRVELAHFAVYFVAGAALLLYLRRTTESITRGQQLKWITSGALVGVVPFAVFYLIPYLTGIRISIIMDVSVHGLALIPVTFGYAVTKYRLMDVDLIFKRSMTYVMASSALLGLYVGLVVLIGRAAEVFSPQSGFLLFAVSGLLVALLFAPLKDMIQERIDRYFYKDQYKYRRSITEFGRTLGIEVSLDRLSERICSRIQMTFDISPVALFLRLQPDSSRYQLFYEEGLDLGESGMISLDIPERVFTDYNRLLAPVFLTPPDAEVERLRQELHSLRIRYLQPLRVRERVTGFLALGERGGKEFLSSEDLDLVASLSSYAAIAVDNALLYRSLETKAVELAQLKVYSENVVESISLGIAVVSPEGRVTVWNSAQQRITGQSREDVIGKTLEEVLPADLIQSMRRVVEDDCWSVREITRLYKTHLKVKKREGRLVNLTISPFVSHDDVMTGTLLIFDDITDKARLEDQLLQSEKLSSIGLFAAGVAHEVNTPLTGISSYTQMLLKETPADSPQRPILEKIERQTFRASGIVNSLLNFARVSESDFREINLNSLMMETVSLIEHQLSKAKVNVKLDLDPSLPSTFGNGGKLQQVFMNLFLNAKDAMPSGGMLRVRTTLEDSFLVVEFEDSGVGISRDDIKKIYDPFFTTKEIGKGTGLGLSVSYGIIQEHSGRISVESAPDKGTRFTLHLPVKRVN